MAMKGSNKPLFNLTLLFTFTLFYSFRHIKAVASQTAFALGPAFVPQAKSGPNMLKQHNVGALK